MSKPASILLVDDQSLYREGLIELFRRWEEFKVAGDAANGKEAVACVEKLHPDIVLMDVMMPVMNGIDACRTIKAANPNVSVVMLTLYGDRERVLASIKAGASGYLLKNIHAQQLRSKLSTVSQGGVALSDEPAALCLDELRNPLSPAPHDAHTAKVLDSLTEEDRELLRLLAMGASNKEIGERLFLGEGTIKKKMSFLLTKLGANNRVQAAIFALKSGIAN